MSGCEYRLSSKMHCGKPGDVLYDGIEPNGGRFYCWQHRIAVARNRAALARRNEEERKEREERREEHRPC